MATVISQKLVLYIIPIIVAAFLLFNYYGGDESAFESLKSGVDSAKEYVPNISIGDKGLSASKPDISTEHKAQLTNLKNAIEKMLSSSEKNCFANYGGFSPLGEKGTSIVMTRSDGGTKFRVLGGAGGDQLVTDLSFEIEGMIPCVIAGDSTITKNFDKSFLTGKSIVDNHFRNVNSITLHYYEGATLACKNGNQILVPELGKDIVNDECFNFQDAGIIYTPDNEHICFFPTILGDAAGNCDGSSAEGLDNDCLGEDPDEDIAIPRQVREGKLKTC
ncbi:hypothetical protein HON71_03280 [Candidatus Woesearchaeota archaeon]|jgi:hypothetical protein|nr:hypothetical protein [Candidatus Woesearchaeota archaeon]